MKLSTSDGRSVTISQIFGIGRNYAAHAHEQGLEAPEHPMVFAKNIASVIADGEEPTKHLTHTRRYSRSPSMPFALNTDDGH